MDLLNAVLKPFSRRKELTAAAKRIGQVFDDKKGVGQSFFDHILTRFKTFDDENGKHQNNAFYDDVDFITQRFTESFKSEKECKWFSERIDAYLYVYSRIQEYLEIIERKHYLTSDLKDSVKKLQEAIVVNASKAFEDTKGLQPNLCTTDKNLLKRMKIDTYRLEISIVNRTNLSSFLCFCKLSLQASLLIDPDKRLQWKTIINDIEHFEIPFQTLIMKYVDFTLGFKDFPLDVPGFVQLISRPPPVTKSDESPLSVLCNHIKILDLKFDEFLDHFLPIFSWESKNKPYKMIHAGDFLSILGRRERYFAEYLSAYATSVDTDTLWKLFLYLCQISELNEIIQKHLLLKVNDRISNVTPTKFFNYTELADKSMEQLKEEKRFQFRKVCMTIFNAFILQQLTDERYRYYKQDFEKLLKILIRYAPSMNDAIKEPSFSLIIQNMLFWGDKNYGTSKEKLKNLVRRMNELDKQILDSVDPKDVIHDDWIQASLLLNNPQDFVDTLDYNFYRDLCEKSSKNQWIIYTWERILNLSFMKPAFNNTKEVLMKLNQWMETVEHDRYNENDVFTITLINQLFKHVISRYSKSILSLPKIENIMDFILSLQKENDGTPFREEMTRFIQQVQRSISNVLKLQGKLKKTM